jgi:hypothetical protein
MAALLAFRRGRGREAVGGGGTEPARELCNNWSWGIMLGDKYDVKRIGKGDKH